MDEYPKSPDMGKVFLQIEKKLLEFPSPSQPPAEWTQVNDPSFNTTGNRAVKPGPEFSIHSIVRKYKVSLKTLCFEVIKQK